VKLFNDWRNSVIFASTGDDQPLLEYSWPAVVLEMRCFYSFSEVLEAILDVNEKLNS